jgi:hypothetical protein
MASGIPMLEPFAAHLPEFNQEKYSGSEGERFGPIPPPQSFRLPIAELEHHRCISQLQVPTPDFGGRALGARRRHCLGSRDLAPVDVGGTSMEPAAEEPLTPWNQARRVLAEVKQQRRPRRLPLKSLAKSLEIIRNH